MALWKYFKREVKTPLPSSTGRLSSAISSGGIVTANKEVQCVMDTNNDRTLLKRGPYEHFNNEERAQIGRYTADHRVAAAIKHYQLHARLEKALCAHGGIIIFEIYK